jgi:hypothetical protein
LLTFVYDFLHLSSITIPKNNENSQFDMYNNNLLGVVAGSNNVQLKRMARVMFGHITM